MLSKLVADAWLSFPPNPATQFDGPDAFISILEQAILLKHLRDLDSRIQVREILGDSWPYWRSHGEQLAARHREEQDKEENTQLQEDVESESESDDDNDSIDVPLKDAETLVKSCDHPALHHPERLIIRLRRPTNVPIVEPVESIDIIYWLVIPPRF
ncbi:DEAD/DEAH box helicase [Ceratobasidium sp. AG-Ba]|nr:DEAD/DEAH box helicase [Ceratobasidium sp. AG-Ba]